MISYMFDDHQKTPMGSRSLGTNSLVLDMPSSLFYLVSDNLIQGNRMNKKRKESKADTLVEEFSHVDSRQKVIKKNEPGRGRKVRLQRLEPTKSVQSE